MPASVLLIIMDGWGIAPAGPGNAVTLAKTPYFDRLAAGYPSTQLSASGEAVGLPHAEDGNSEVGHINLGAGQIIFQDLPRINSAIADGSFFQNPALLAASQHVKLNRSTLHLIGLVGSGGVHANNEHLFALIKFAKQQACLRLALHLITDGRDSPPTTSAVYISEVEKRLQQAQLGQISSIMGRYYAMDRDFRWERTEKTYRCLTEGVGQQSRTALEAINQSYRQQKTDEFIEPTVITDSNQVPLALISDNDAVIFYNFRVDRPRQLTKAFVLQDFAQQANQLAFDPHADKYLDSHLPQKASVYPPFPRRIFLKNLLFVTMTEYQKNLTAKVVMPQLTVEFPLSRVISEANFRQLKLAESEKERFVTYYFNGLREQPFQGEDWKIVPSPKVETYDLQPAMSTPELTQAALTALQQRQYQFICLNIACPDMVAHSGNLTASIKACEAVDQLLSRVIPAALATNTFTLITADHGNVEELINLQTGAIDTEHSNNPVPFIFVNPSAADQRKKLTRGILADIAPTILKLLNLAMPGSMTGRTLF